MEIPRAARIRLEKYYAIILVITENSQNKKGVYLKISKSALDESARTNHKNILSLGEIVASFDGETPPKEISEYISTLTQ